MQRRRQRQATIPRACCHDVCARQTRPGAVQASRKTSARRSGGRRHGAAAQRVESSCTGVVAAPPAGCPSAQPLNRVWPTHKPPGAHLGATLSAGARWSRGSAIATVRDKPGGASRRRGQGSETARCGQCRPCVIARSLPTVTGACLTAGPRVSRPLNTVHGRSSCPAPKLCAQGLLQFNQPRRCIDQGFPRHGPPPRSTVHGARPAVRPVCTAVAARRLARWAGCWGLHGWGSMAGAPVWPPQPLVGGSGGSRGCRPPPPSAYQCTLARRSRTGHVNVQHAYRLLSLCHGNVNGAWPAQATPAAQAAPVATAPQGQHARSRKAAGRDIQSRPGQQSRSHGERCGQWAAPGGEAEDEE